MCDSSYRFLCPLQIPAEDIAPASWSNICARRDFLKIKRNHSPHQKYNHWRTTVSCWGTLTVSAGLLPPSKQGTRKSTDEICLQGENTTLKAVLLRIVMHIFLLNPHRLGKGRKLMQKVLLTADKYQGVQLTKCNI